MIPCNHCGQDNDLGTLFCRSCGQRIEIDPSAINASIAQTTHQTRVAKMLRGARNALGIACFLCVATLFIRYAAVGSLPPLRMPMPPPATGEALLPPQERGDDGGAIALQVGTSSGSLVDWRLGNASYLLGDLGLEVDHLRAWQMRIIDAQKDDGSFLGSDPLTSTAAAVLALQALPGHTVVDRAAAAGRAWLTRRFDAVYRSTDRHHQGLLGMVLMEADQLAPNDRATFAAIVGSGERLSWQAMALPLFSVQHRPRDLVLFRRALAADSPIWRHYLDCFSAEPLVADREAADDLFTAETAAGLDPMQRWVWAQTAWYRSADPTVLGAVLRDWAGAADPPTPASDIARELGPQAAEILAVLAVCAPLRTPVGRGQPAR